MRGQVCSRTAMGAWTALLPARFNCANRSFAGTTVPRHFARTGPVLVHLVRAGPVPVHFAPAGPLLGDVARAGFLPAHFARAGSFGAFGCAGQVLGHLLQSVLGRLVRLARAVRAAPAVRARPVPVYLPRPPKPGIASTSLRLVAHCFRPQSDWQVQQGQQFSHAPGRPLQSAAKPERSIELLASIDRCQAATPICRPAKP